MRTINAALVKLEPPDPGSATDKLFKLIGNYTHHPKDKSLQVIAYSPQKWYTDRELIILFKKIRGQIELSMEADRKRIKEMRGPSGRSIGREVQEGYLQDAKKDRLNDLVKFKNLIPEVVDDYKKRLVKALDKMNPSDRDRLKGSPELSWVDNPTAFITKAQNTLLLDEEMNRIKEYQLLGTEFELDKRETGKPEPKQTGGEMVPFAKYREIEDELKMTKYEIKKVAEKFKFMPIPAVEEKKNASNIQYAIRVMAAEGYQYLSDEKKKNIIDKYMDYKGGKQPGYGAPSDIEWVVGDAELQKTIEKAESERDILDSNRRESVPEKERRRLDRLYNEKIEELRLLRDIEKNRKHRVRFVERSKEEWNKSEAEGVLMESAEGLKKLEAKFAEIVKAYRPWMDACIQKSSGGEKEELEETNNDVNQDVSRSIRPVTSEKFIQVQYANTLISALEWYKKLHSLYRGASWSQNRSSFRVEEKNIADMRKEYLTVKTSGDSEQETLYTEYRKISSLRNKSYDQLKRFVNNDIHSLNSPYADADTAIESLQAFSSACKDYLKNLEKTGQKIDFYNARLGKHLSFSKSKTVVFKFIESTIKKLSGEIGELAVVKDFDKIFPKEQTLAKLRGIEHYDWAEEELDEIYNFFKREFISPSPNLESNAEAAGEEPRDLMRRYMDAVLDVFIKTWTKVNEFKEDTSYWVIKKYPNLYKEILELQRGGVFPKLSMSKIKPISKGVPSRKNVIDYIEKNWLRSTPSAFKDAMQKWEHLFDHPFKEEGGGGAGAGKGRVNHSKEPTPVVHGTQEQIDRELVDFLKTDQTPEAFIKDLLFNIGKSLRKEFDADKIIDVGTVATSLASILSDIPKMMRNLWVQVPGVSDRSVRAETSKEVEKMKRHPPQFAPGTKPEEEEIPIQYKTMIEPGPWHHRRTRPDIILTGKPTEQLNDALKMFEKIKKLYRIIAFYLGKDALRVEDTRHGVGYPDGLLDGIDHLHRILRRGPHAPEVQEAKLILPLSYKLARKFLDQGMKILTEGLR